MKPLIEIEKLRTLLSVNTETGVLTWIVSPCRAIPAGQVAGYLNSQGYLTVQVKGRQYQAHRLVWALHHGSWPVDQVDHINGIRSDNRLANLRDVTASQNGQNRVPLGAHLGKTRKRWEARIFVDGRSIHLGMFYDKDQAHQTYLAAKALLHPASARAFRQRT